MAAALLAALLTAVATWLSGPFGRRGQPGRSGRVGRGWTSGHLDRAEFARGASGGEPASSGLAVNGSLHDDGDGNTAAGDGSSGGSARWFSRTFSHGVSRTVSRGASDTVSRDGSRATVRGVTSRDVTTSLVLLALAYRSGLPTTSVLTSVANGVSDAAARDLRQVAAALQWGADESEAWASVAVAWQPAARALQVAHAAGLPPGSLLLRASDDLQNAEVERLEVSAARAGVRLVLPLGLVLLPAFCLTAVVPLIVALGQELLTGR